MKSGASTKVTPVILQVMRHFIQAEESGSCQLHKKGLQGSWDEVRFGGIKAAFVCVR